MLQETHVTIPTPDGAPAGLLFASDEGQPRPGVLFLTDIFGIREAQNGMARRIAQAGYTVLAPNIFYRSAKPPVIEMPVNFTDPKFRERMGELTGPLTPEAGDRDAAAYVDFLSSQPSVSGAPLAVIGFCYSGALAMRAAAARPDRVGLVASFHGGRLCTDDPASPHTLLPRIKARLYFGHAEDDRSMPREQIEKFEEELARWGGPYESEIYHAGHGWTVPDSHAYDQPEAERAHAKLMALLAGLSRQ